MLVQLTRSTLHNNCPHLAMCLWQDTMTTCTTATGIPRTKYNIVTNPWPMINVKYYVKYKSLTWTQNHGLLNSNSETGWIPIPENKPFSIWILGPPDSKASNGDNIASASIADSQKKCAHLPFQKNKCSCWWAAKIWQWQNLIMSEDWHPPPNFAKGQFFAFVQISPL